MQEYMLDIETLGVTPGAIVLSIGVVAFTQQQGIQGSYYVVVDQHCPENLIREFSQETVTWWQNPTRQQAWEALDQAPVKATLTGALQGLASFMLTGVTSKCRVWGNGPGFDQAILTHAFRQCKVVCPWSYWSERCYRTAMELLLGSTRSAVPREGVYHNALDDALTQTKRLMDARRRAGV